MGIIYLLLPFILVSLIIIFQPEIRRWLKRVARLKLFITGLIPGDLDPEDLAKDITQIVFAVKELAISKYGALIVIEPPETGHDYLSPGTEINGDISSNLILSIFTPKSPLHDGATIIQKDKIKGAGVILPITDNRQLSPIFGTRHRAALGLTEVFDCMCIVVSEETGSVSVAFHGKLLPCNKTDELTDYLTHFYSQLQITSSITESEMTSRDINSLPDKSQKSEDSVPDERSIQPADA
jgi:diadenylate cyclase